jgi:glycosyltransferase involved in cell wall biosynthesis
VPSLDLYRPENPFRIPWPWEFKTTIDVREFAIMCGAGFPEPSTFSRRVRRLLQERPDDFDLVHDNQCLGRALVPMMEKDGWPVLATLHHPITVDRELDLQHAPNAWKRFTIRRWYSFLEMQMEVAQQIPRHLTVSESSRRDIAAQMGVPAERLHVVPVGRRSRHLRTPAGDRTRARPAHDDGERRRADEGSRAPARSAGQGPHRARRRAPRGDRQAQGQEPIPALIERLGITGRVEFVSGVTTERIIELYAEAELAVVPSLYEGFSLPAVERWPAVCRCSARPAAPCPR